MILFENFQNEKVFDLYGRLSSIRKNDVGKRTWPKDWFYDIPFRYFTLYTRGGYKATGNYLETLKL